MTQNVNRNCILTALPNQHCANVASQNCWQVCLHCHKVTNCNLQLLVKGKVIALSPPPTLCIRPTTKCWNSISGANTSTGTSEKALDDHHHRPHTKPPTQPSPKNKRRIAQTHTHSYFQEELLRRWNNIILFFCEAHNPGLHKCSLCSEIQRFSSHPRKLWDQLQKHRRQSDDDVGAQSSTVSHARNYHPETWMYSFCGVAFGKQLGKIFLIAIHRVAVCWCWGKNWDNFISGWNWRTWNNTSIFVCRQDQNKMQYILISFNFVKFNTFKSLPSYFSRCSISVTNTPLSVNIINMKQIQR